MIPDKISGFSTKDSREIDIFSFFFIFEKRNRIGKKRGESVKISEITINSHNVEIPKAEVVEKEDARDVDTKYGTKRVANATIKDDSGSIQISLWEQQIDNVNVGDSVKIEGGFVKEYNEVLSLGVPKAGKIEVLEKK